MADFNKVKSLIKLIEEMSPIRNEITMSELIYCKLIIQNHQESFDITEKDYIDLCKIGLNLNTNIKMKYRIAVCYLNYLNQHTSNFDEFEKAYHFTLNILINSCENNDWHSNAIIGKFHQVIGRLLGDYVLKSENYNKIFKLAYEHFNLGLSIFNSNELFYYKSLLIIDYVKVIYSHLIFNKIWSKNLILICLSLLKESEVALERYKDNIDFIVISDTDTFKQCINLTVILEIELYIIMNTLEEKSMYDSQMPIKNMINNYILDSYIPSSINDKFKSLKEISLEEAKSICMNMKEYSSLNNINNNIHTLFLYGVVNYLNSNDKNESVIIDINNSLLKKTLKIGECYRKEIFNVFKKRINSNSNDCDLNISNINEDFFTYFYNSKDFTLLDKLIKKYEDQAKEVKTVTNDEVINNKPTQPSNSLDPKKGKKLTKLESAVNVLAAKENAVTTTTDNGKIPTPDSNNNNNNNINNTINNDEIINIKEDFKNVITIGLASLNYQYVELCSEYLYNLTNDDPSQKFW
ncbi:hypothetical protein PIROE2DRAFT_58695 [Piromyces sp. E2]|nr:hypothetical protein PIROE2DRAFT_58695 [Piromyces sp. E2]|eukprot:OUM67558.1 hypothetical protein PIROE2DRAFT_58695 [Piromyces sp. E2]